jgi:hypothetical protein
MARCGLMSGVRGAVEGVVGRLVRIDLRGEAEDGESGASV